jgi:hypothetical protein
MAINIRNDKNNHRSSATCTYCGGDHTITGCQEILSDAETAKRKKFANRTFKEHYAMQWVEKKAKTKKKRAKSKRKCGYCGGEGHTRRDCKVMQEDRKFLVQANRTWRKLYADNSKKFGYAPACLVKYNNSQYNYNTGRYENTSQIALVGSELPSNLTVFVLSKEYNMRQEINIPLVGLQNPVTLREFVKGSPVQGKLTGNSYVWGDKSIEVINSSEYVFTDEWINADCDDINFVLKKWNRDRLNDCVFRQIRENIGHLM